jgi:hypothetical protein
MENQGTINHYREEQYYIGDVWQIQAHAVFVMLQMIHGDIPY